MSNVTKFSPVSRGFARIEEGADNRFTVTVSRSQGPKSDKDIVCVHKRCKRVDIEPQLQTEVVNGMTWTSTPVVTYQSYETKTVSLVEHLPNGVPGLNRLV